MKKVEITETCEFGGNRYEEGETYEFEDNIADKVAEEGYGETVEEEPPEINVDSEGSGKIQAKTHKETEDLGEMDSKATQRQEKTESSERMIDKETQEKKLNNLLHKQYQECWGEDYEVPKKQFLKKHFDKEHTNELSTDEKGKATNLMDRRINQKDIEEKAEDEVSTGSGAGQMLEQRQKRESKGNVSVEKAREMAKTMGSPQMVKDLIDGMDFEDLEQYVWDPDENPDLPYKDLEPKVDLYEMVMPLWEMFTGWSYDIGPFEFNKDEENDVYECKVTITRKGGPSDPTKIEFTKTKKKGNLMKQRDVDKGIEKEQWKEFMQSLAFKRAMRPQMRLWVDKFVNAYRKAKR